MTRKFLFACEKDGGIIMSLIKISDLTFYYDGSYDNIFENVSFQIDSRWKLGLVGRNGRGKTTFLNLLMKKYEYKGNILSSVEFEYFPFCLENTAKDTMGIVEKVDPSYEL
jgi:lincosamide and streptogramin A transport system ATP-binding/permease protein